MTTDLKSDLDRQCMNCGWAACRHGHGEDGPWTVCPPPRRICGICDYGVTGACVCEPEDQEPPIVEPPLPPATVEAAGRIMAVIRADVGNFANAMLMLGSATKWTETAFRRFRRRQQGPPPLCVDGHAYRRRQLARGSRRG